jgi:putative two-component system response regulator
MPTPTSPQPATIVLVDDDPVSLGLLEEIIGAMPLTSVVAFAEPEEALAWCHASTPDVIVSDYHMPGMDGLELLALLRAEQQLRDVPIMIVTALNDREVRYRALEIGASDFLAKPLDQHEVVARIRNMILVRQAQQGLEVRARELAFQVRLATESLIQREREAIIRLGRAGEFRDWGSSAHTQRVARYAGAIARGCGLSEADTERIELAAQMHDVGKIGIPDSILLKAGPLAPAEYEVMKQHTVIGERVLGDSSSALLRYAAVIARSHHERMDGSGYPDGLKGEEIPLSARIVAVADVFDAMTADRPYRKASPIEAAIAHLRNSAGRHFDARCVDALLAALPAMLEARERSKDAA